MKRTSPMAIVGLLLFLCVGAVIVVTMRAADAETSPDPKSATLTIKEVQYFGGFTTEMTIRNKEATFEYYQEIGGKRLTFDGEIKNTTHELTPDQKAMFAEAIKIIVNKELWDQKDSKASGIADGGERTFEFTVGDKTGKFQLINDSPEHLLDFLSTTGKLTASIRESVKASRVRE